MMKPFRSDSSPALSSYGATCRRIVSDFTELPGLRITAAQAQRLWNLEPFACEAMLNAFVDAGFLARDGRGEFVLSPTPQGRASA